MSNIINFRKRNDEARARKERVALGKERQESPEPEEFGKIRTIKEQEKLIELHKWEYLDPPQQIIFAGDHKPEKVKVDEEEITNSSVLKKNPDEMSERELAKIGLLG